MKSTEQQKIKTSIPPRLPGVEYDEDGLPIGHTVEEVTNRLNQELIDFYGEDIRKMVNEERAKWNEKYSWRFDPL